MTTSKSTADRPERTIKVTGIRRETLDPQHIGTVADIFIQQGMDIARAKRGKPPMTESERKQFGLLLAQTQAMDKTGHKIQDEPPRVQPAQVSPVSPSMAEPEAEPVVVAPRTARRRLPGWLRTR